MRAIFHHLCPNCGGPISDKRLSEKLPCSKCLKEKVSAESFEELVEKIYEKLKIENNLKEYKEFYELEKELREFEEFFKEKVGNKLWSAQKTWTRRILKGESFTIIAPTGVGKTTLAAALSVWLSQKKNKRVYFIVPTTTLVKQTAEKIINFGGDPVYFYTGMRKKEKERFLEAIREGNFEILVTTSQFLARRFEDLKHLKFDVIFVDDVDALLKASKNIERVLMLAGFKENEIEWANEIINIKYRIAMTKDEKKIKEYFEKIKKFNEYIEGRRKSVGQIIMMSATARPRGRKPKLFRELLGFEIGSSGGGLRNIEDLYILTDNIFEKIYEVVKEFGTGGLIFVAKDLGEEYCRKLNEFLRERGINCDVFVSGEKKGKLEKFESGEIDILIGVAHFYGLLVRGIDLPARVRYCVFFEVPRFKARIEEALYNPFFLLYFLDEIYNLTREDSFRKYSDEIQRFLRESSRGAIQLAFRKLSGEEIEVSERIEGFVKLVLEAREKVLEALKNKDIFEKIKESRNFYIEGDYVFFPDVNTYIQASGRCSRLFAGGLTKGASIVVTKNKRLLEILERKMGWRYPEFEFKDYYSIDRKKLIEEIDRDRELVRKIQRGEIPSEFKDPIKSILFIVESPNKARTIANFFGKPSVRRKGSLRIYEVTTGDYIIDIVATKGHIFDLVTREGYHGVLEMNGRWIPVYNTIKTCLDCGESFNDDFEECPYCGSKNIYDKIEIVKLLRELAKEVDLVLIATDPDSVTGDSIVFVKEDRKERKEKIEKLFEEWKKKFGSFMKNDHEYIELKNILVKAVDPKSFEVVWTKAKYLIRHFVRKKIYRIRTKRGFEVKVTGDHSLFKIIKRRIPANLPEKFKLIYVSEEKASKFSELEKELGFEKAIDVLKPFDIFEFRRGSPIYRVSGPEQHRFAIIFEEENVLVEVKASELKKGDKIVVVDGKNVFEDEIVEIEEKDFEGYVYDFDTETDNFIASNVLCHNTEGEKIAWDVYNIINPFVKNVKRAEFHEVTERAILEAIRNPRDINYNLVEAQIVRRIEDRWIGFELSSLLQRYFKRKNMSAGRVQTPVLKWIIERFDEREKDLHYFFEVDCGEFKFEFDLPIKEEEKAREIANKIKEVEVKVIGEEERVVNPLPPFETQTMISEASRFLGWGAGKTMRIAQDLFELGLSTYIRTDSTRVAPEGIALARRYISEVFGEEFYKGRPWGEGGAHECIRPTKPIDVRRLLELVSEGVYRGVTKDHIALYDLIFRRFIASQMIPAKIVYRKVKIRIPGIIEKEIEVPFKIKEKGWLMVYPAIEEKKIESGKYKVISVSYRLDSKIILFTEGSLVAEMRKRGIGRPSTYATIIQKIRRRRYVRGRRFLIPTPLGRRVIEFLFKSYSDLVGEERTRELEEKMDKIEKGEVKYQDVLRELFEELRKYGFLRISRT